jgi:hypothetical protein
MAINSSTELGMFQEFLVLRSSDANLPSSLDEAVEQFRSYQSELIDLKAKLQIGLDQCNAGQTKPLDATMLKQQLRERLSSKQG